DGRPPAGPIRDGPTAIRGLRTRRRRPVLPATPKTQKPKAGPSDSVGLTATTTIGHHQHTANDRNNPVPYSWQTGGPITLAGDNTGSVFRRRRHPRPNRRRPMRSRALRLSASPIDNATAHNAYSRCPRRL